MNHHTLFVDMLERQNKELREFNKELVDMLRLCTGLNVLDEIRNACEAKRGSFGPLRDFNPKEDDDNGC